MLKTTLATTATLAFGVGIVLSTQFILNGTNLKTIADETAAEPTLSASAELFEIDQIGPMPMAVAATAAEDDDWCKADAKAGQYFNPCTVEEQGNTVCGGDGVEAKCNNLGWYGTGNCCTRPNDGNDDTDTSTPTQVCLAKPACSAGNNRSTTITFYCTKFDSQGKCERGSDQVGSQENGTFFWKDGYAKDPSCYVWQKDVFCRDTNANANDGQANWNCFQEHSIGGTYNPNCGGTSTPKIACNAKTSSKTTVIPGDYITYKVNYTLTEDVTELTILDDYDENAIIIYGVESINGVTCTEWITNGPGTQGKLSCKMTYGDGLKKGTHEVGFKAMVKDTLVQNQSIVNRIESIGAKKGTVNATVTANNCINTMTLQVPVEPELNCTNKTSDKAIYTQGETVNYTVTYTVAKNSVENLTIIDLLDLGGVQINENSFPNGYNCIVTPYIMMDVPNGNKTRITCTKPGTTNPGSYSISYSGTAILPSVNTVNKISKIFGTYNEETIYGEANSNGVCGNAVEVREPLSELVCNTKTINKSEVMIGDTVTFTVTYSNPSTVAEDKVYLVDSSGQYMGTSYTNVRNIRYNGTAYTGCTANDLMTGECQMPTLAAGASATVKFDATVSNLDDLRNHAAIRYGDHGVFTSGTACTITEPTPLYPDFACVAKFSTTPETRMVKPGDEIEYGIQYTVNNFPTGERAGVTDFLPEGTSYVEGSAKLYNTSSELIGDADCEVRSDTGYLHCYAETSGTIRFKVTVNENINQEYILNRAGVSYSTYDPSYCNQVRHYVEYPSLVCKSKVPSTENAYIGEEVEFLITYQNTNEVETTNDIVLIDTLPTGMEFVSSEDNKCSANGDVVTCTTDERLGYGEIANFRITVRITDEAAYGSTLVNSVDSLTSGPATGEVEECVGEVTVKYPKPKVVIEKVVKSPADKDMVLGDDAETMEDNATFRITVTNDGPTTLVTVPLTDKFYAEDFDFVSAWNGTTQFNPDRTETTTAPHPVTYLYWDNIGAIDSGSSRIIDVVLKVKETYVDQNNDLVCNYANVTDVVDEYGTDANDDEDSDCVTIEGNILGEEVEISVNKTLITVQTTEPDETVKFHIVVTNTGDKELTEIKFVDDYDNNYLLFVGFSEEIAHGTAGDGLFEIDSANGIFTHNNILTGMDALEPGEAVEFDVWFVARTKKGTTTNCAVVMTEDDKNDESCDDVKIDYEELADTGSNIVIALATGSMLIAAGYVLNRKYR